MPITKIQRVFMFGFIKEKIKKVYSSFTQQMSALFSRTTIDDQLMQDLKKLLLEADTGVKTTNMVIETLVVQVKKATITSVEQLKQELEKILKVQLQTSASPNTQPRVLMLVGVNGSGKTTVSAKLAQKFKREGKRVILVAGDTFRAAATQQLMNWGQQVGVPVFVGRENQDPAAVVFDACKKFAEERYDHIIIDTAGRLQTKVNLMKELEKVRKIISRQLPEETISTFLTIDAMLGQNSLRQAEVFHEAVALDGVLLTKLDGTGKGGVVFSIVQQMQLPIVYVTYGEKLEDIEVFNVASFVHDLLYE